MKARLEKLRVNTELIRCGFYSLAHPDFDWMEPRQQMHPEFRKGTVNVCDAQLSYLKRIGQELFEQADELVPPSQSRLQLAPKEQCCK